MSNEKYLLNNMTDDFTPLAPLIYILFIFLGFGRDLHSIKDLKNYVFNCESNQNKRKENKINMCIHFCEHNCCCCSLN